MKTASKLFILALLVILISNITYYGVDIGIPIKIIAFALLMITLDYLETRQQLEQALSAISAGKVIPPLIALGFLLLSATPSWAFGLGNEDPSLTWWGSIKYMIFTPSPLSPFILMCAVYLVIKVGLEISYLVTDLIAKWHKRRTATTILFLLLTASLAAAPAGAATMLEGSVHSYYVAHPPTPNFWEMPALIAIICLLPFLLQSVLRFLARRLLTTAILLTAGLLAFAAVPSWALDPSFSSLHQHINSPGTIGERIAAGVLVIGIIIFIGWILRSAVRDARNSSSPLKLLLAGLLLLCAKPVWALDRAGGGIIDHLSKQDYGLIIILVATAIIMLIDIHRRRKSDQYH